MSRWTVTITEEHTFNILVEGDFDNHEEVETRVSEGTDDEWDQWVAGQPDTRTVTDVYAERWRDPWERMERYTGGPADVAVWQRLSREGGL